MSETSGPDPSCTLTPRSGRSTLEEPVNLEHPYIFLNPGIQVLN